MVLDDEDIPVDDNASSQESVADVDEEGKVIDVMAEELIDPLANHGHGDNVADTETGVKNHQPVKERLCGLSHDELQ